MSGVVLAVLCFVLFFLAHLAASHLLRIGRKEGVLLGFMAAAGGAYVLGYASLVERVRALSGPSVVSPAVDFLTGLAGFGFLALGYVEFWSLFERSVSLRILIDTAADPEGLTPDQMARRYAEGRGLEWMMDKRIADLVGSGMLVESTHGYRLSGRARVVARVFRGLQRVVGSS